MAITWRVQSVIVYLQRQSRSSGCAVCLGGVLVSAVIFLIVSQVMHLPAGVQGRAMCAPSEVVG